MDTQEKQAYLVEAHRCDEMLLTLLRMLDVPWNDIFIHMDSKNTSYQPEVTEQYLKHAHVYHTQQRVSVTWAGVSQTKAELALLKTAVAHGPYQHYHLISGVDLPIQKPEDIRAFFEANPDKEFFNFMAGTFSPEFDDWVHYYHVFQDRDIRGHAALYGIRDFLIALQKLVGIKRSRDVVFQKGSNWFSCTDAFAKYLLSKEAWILETFDRTHCSDEIFTQTLLYQSEYWQNRYQGVGDGNMRAIDWARGNGCGSPHIWQDADLEFLKASPCMFARKFDYQTAPKLIQELERLYGPAQ